MCGIAGIIQTEPGLFNKDHLQKMTGTLVHRGPEGEGLWQNANGKALLGHRRLAIIDRSNAAAQPMHYMGRYTIIHNGEIYNYIELRQVLTQKGYSFHTASDTEVILAAYDHFGDECVDHFDGMFAFAIWDEQEQELFAARDRFGEKPFFYCFNGRSFVFASEMKALWAAGMTRKTNLRMHFNFITIGYVNNPGDPGETFFENIFKLPAASILYVTPSSPMPVIEKYWDIDLSRQEKQMTDEEAIDKFNDLFSSSVKRRLRSDVNVGTSLSGGLDSSSVVAVASRFNTQPPLASFTATFPGFEKDESPFAARVAECFRLRSYTTEIAANDLVNNWKAFVDHQEEPFGSSSAFAQYKVFELAQQSNVTVLLDGQGADETLAGYVKYYKWYWQELFLKRRLWKSKELKAAHELGVHEKFGARNIIASLFPDLASVILERKYLLHALRNDELTEEFIQLQSREAYYSAPAKFDLNGALYFNTCIHGLEELLRYADRNSMAHGRETRLPFLDHQLVEFVFSLPARFKIRQGWTKWILRQCLSEALPAEIAWRKEKVGFEPPQRLWMQDSRIREMIREAKRKLAAEKIIKSSVLDRPPVATGAHDADNHDWRYLASAPYLW